MLFGIVYILMALVTLIVVAVTFVKHEGEDTDIYVIGVLVGFMAGLVWPLTIVLGLLVWLIRWIVHATDANYTKSNRLTVSWKKR